MRLTSVELIGFKSFAKRTVIHFPSGITEIVGPNGSGKSNIIEAIRWALGEQSAKNLRSNRMTDVIFSGSQSHPALNRAKVVLTFDNSDHFVDVNYSQLQIARVVYRDGTNDYYLNGKPCRLRDIQDLFMNTGIGHGSFSIISQGKVAQIFRSKPFDRRFIIETVAGIYKYRNQKVFASQKLTHVDNNLTRINDLTYELGHQLHHLDGERHVAQDYLKKKRLANHLDVSRLFVRFNLLSQQLTKVKNGLKSIKKRSDLANQQINRYRDQKTRLRDQMGQASGRNDQIQNQIMTKSQQISKVSSQRSLDQQRISFWNRQMKTDHAKLVKSTEQSNHLRHRLKQLKSQRVMVLKRLKQLTTIVNRFKTSKQSRLIRRNRQQLRELQTRYIDLIQKSTQINGQINNQQQTNDHNQLQLKVVTDQLHHVKQQIIHVTQQQKTISSEADRIKRQITAWHHQINDLQVKSRQLDEQVSDSEQKNNRTLRKQQLLQVRLTDLKRIVDHHSNLGYGSRNLLNHADQFSGIIGPVAKYIQVSTKYIQAIETTLRSQLQQIIVDTSQTAKRAVQFMSENHLGRVTLLPVNEIAKRWINPRIINECRQVQGFIGVASELVKMPIRLNNVKEHLLGNVLIAENLSAAIQLSRLIHHRYRIVTLNGSVINAGGAITGGQGRYRYHGLLSQKAKAGQLQTSIRNFERIIKRQQAIHNQIEKQKNAVNAKLTRVQDQCNRAQQVLAVKNNLSDRLVDEINHYRQTLSERQQRLTGLTSNKQSRSLPGLMKQRSKLKVSLSDNRSRVHQLNHQLKQQTQAMGQSAKRYHGYRESLIKFQEQKSRVHDEINRTLVVVQQMKQHVTGLKHRIQEVRYQVRTANQNVNNSKQLKDLRDSIKGLKEQKQRYQTMDQRCHQQLLKVIHQTSRTQDQLMKLRDQLNRNQFKLRDLNQKRHEIAEVLFCKYQIDLTQKTCPRLKVSLYDVSSKLFTVQKQLRAMGSVNVNAIQRFKKVNHRYRFLSKQIQDLVTSKHQLVTTMNQMDSKIKARFKQTFDQVNQAFKITYSQIFRGGKAKLTLIDPKHLLTTGINIMAQPPGKRYRNMELLSGGERALTAIALLFAILRIKPAPFCILDEAESALDAVNIDRFGDFMRKLKQRTQFIVITHRKTTMLYADNLYGVTMQNSGISKIISVNLRKAKVKG